MRASSCSSVIQLEKGGRERRGSEVVRRRKWEGSEGQGEGRRGRGRGRGRGKKVRK